VASDVKGRPYDSPRRRAQAAETRRAILDAARPLFEEGGYPSTPVPSIAAEAKVALKTVYLAFETKAGLLRAVWEARLGGEEESIPVLERSWFREVTTEADPVRKLHLVAAQSRRVKTNSGALLEVIRTAAVSDPEIATLWSDIEAKLLRVQRAIVDQLDETKSLARGLTRREATDVMWTLNHPTVWHLLVRERRWSPTHYETWLHDAFCLHLLGPPAAPPDDADEHSTTRQDPPRE
jgi:TetR/AcrR family transcriptional regulator, regulator of autoinduction and epiphytic fitness